MSLQKSSLLDVIIWISLIDLKFKKTKKEAKIYLLIEKGFGGTNYAIPSFSSIWSSTMTKCSFLIKVKRIVRILFWQPIKPS